MQDLFLYLCIFCVFCFGWYKVFEFVNARKNYDNPVYNNPGYLATENNVEEDFTDNENYSETLDYCDWKQDPYYSEYVTEDSQYQLFDMVLDLDSVEYV
jgi:hypothetical protein